MYVLYMYVHTYACTACIGPNPSDTYVHALKMYLKYSNFFHLELKILLSTAIHIIHICTCMSVLYILYCTYKFFDASILPDLSPGPLESRHVGNGLCCQTLQAAVGGVQYTYQHWDPWTNMYVHTYIHMYLVCTCSYTMHNSVM